MLSRNKKPASLAPFWIHSDRGISCCEAPCRHSQSVLPDPSGTAPSSDFAFESGTWREYAKFCVQLAFPSHATLEDGHRRMMRVDEEHASSGPETTSIFDLTVAGHAIIQPSLVFETLPLPEMGLTFLPRPPPLPRKRSRPVADIDGEYSCMQKKKRRLRLFLITSRLSPQFSHPATNIVDRGSSKIAIWAKQRSLGRNLLRKAAILNRIRRRAVTAKEAAEGHGRVLVEQEREQKELELAKLEFNQGSVDTYTRPVIVKASSVPPAVAVRSGGRFVVSGSLTSSPTPSRSPSPTPPSPPRSVAKDEKLSEYCSPNDAYAYSPPRAQLPRRDYLPLPPSPLGLSNYDAFDMDEGVPNPYSHLDDEGVPNPYSHLDDEDDAPSTHLFDDDDDEDEETVPFSPLAVSSTPSSSTTSIHPSAPHTSKSSPPFFPFTLLDDTSPVFAAYDQVDDAVWPSSFARAAEAPVPNLQSHDLAALFAPAPAPQVPKRADSFAASPNFRPALLVPGSASSPNFTPTITTTGYGPVLSPTIAPASQSPNFPPFSSSSCNAAVSPNFSAWSDPFAFDDDDASFSHPSFAQRRLSVPTIARTEERGRRSSDIEGERKRMRDLMFLRFG